MRAMNVCFASICFLSFIVGCDLDVDATASDSGPCIEISRVKGVVYPPAGVRITFRVLGCDGYPGKKLTKNNVTVLNDEKGQPFGVGGEGGGASAPDLPSEYGLYSILLLDMSSSIFENKAVDDVINGARIFVQKMVTEAPVELKQNVALMVFGMPTKTRIVQSFTSDAAVLNAKLEEIRSSESLGTTDLYGALLKGLHEVQGVGKDLGVVERSVVILTDGTHEAGDDENMRPAALAAKNEAETNDVTVFSIGIKGQYDEEKIRELASKTDYFVLAENAAALTGVYEAVAERVAAIAESNYVVGICTPVVFGSPSLTIEISVDNVHASKAVPYPTDSLEGDVESCNPDLIANPCGARECGSGALPGFDCGSCGACGTECVAGQCDFVACYGLDCGDDGCGGICGTCLDGWRCGSDQKCFDICAGRDCGSDGYGGICGTCQENWHCGSDQHCFDPCAGRACGSDGYGGNCGTCGGNAACAEGACSYLGWVDPTTDLVWQRNVASQYFDWDSAKTYCNDNQESLPGVGWRLPTISELRSFIRGCEGTSTAGPCKATDGCLSSECWSELPCTNCSPNDGPASGCYWDASLQGWCASSWSDSILSNASYLAWYVSFVNGEVHYANVIKDQGVRCVRAGP
jgi:Mg-chelatase subunit ChlD